jgi:hypothetical protein
MYVTYNYELLQPVKIGLYFIAGYYFLPLIVAIGGLILAVVGLAVAFALYIIVAIPLALIGALAALLQFVARWLWNAIQEAMGHLPASDQGLQWIAAFLGAIGTAQILDSLVHTFSSQDYWGVVRQVAFTAVALVVLRKAEGPQSTPSRR